MTSYMSAKEQDSQRKSVTMKRRNFLSTSGAALGCAALSTTQTGKSCAANNSRSNLRFAFLPCIHLREDLRAPEGFAQALRAVGRLSPKPAFILTGGDLCHNLRDEGLAEATKRADLFVRILSLPAIHQLDLVTPGIAPRKASSRNAMRDNPKRRRKPRLLPVIWQCRRHSFVIRFYPPACNRR